MLPGSTIVGILRAGPFHLITRESRILSDTADQVAGGEYLHEILHEEMPVLGPDPVNSECQTDSEEWGIILIDGFHNLHGPGILMFKFFKGNERHAVDKKPEYTVKIRFRHS